MLAKDKEFVAWRAEHPESYVPRRASQRPRSARRGSTGRMGPMLVHAAGAAATGEALA
jgi:hypothetical protein